MSVIDAGREVGVREPRLGRIRVLHNVDKESVSSADGRDVIKGRDGQMHVTTVEDLGKAETKRPVKQERCQD